MPVLVTCKFDKDPINNEDSSVKTLLSHYSLQNFASAQEHVTLK